MTAGISGAGVVQDLVEPDGDRMVMLLSCFSLAQSGQGIFQDQAMKAEPEILESDVGVIGHDGEACLFSYFNTFQASYPAVIQ